MDGLLVDSEPIWHDVEIDIFGRHGVPLTVRALPRDQGDVPRRRRRALVRPLPLERGVAPTTWRPRSSRPWPGASKRRWSSSPGRSTPSTSVAARGAVLGAGVVVAATAHRRRGAPVRPRRRGSRSCTRARTKRWASPTPPSSSPRPGSSGCDPGRAWCSRTPPRACSPPRARAWRVWRCPRPTPPPRRGCPAPGVAERRFSTCCTRADVVLGSLLELDEAVWDRLSAAYGVRRGSGQPRRPPRHLRAVLGEVVADHVQAEPAQDRRGGLALEQELERLLDQLAVSVPGAIPEPSGRSGGTVTVWEVVTAPSRTSTSKVPSSVGVARIVAHGSDGSVKPRPRPRPAPGGTVSDLYDIPIHTLQGEPSSLAPYKGKALLLVNVASRCGLTPQYTGLQKLQDAYGDKGFSVLGFPCNQFLEQEPGHRRRDRRVLLGQLRRDLPAVREDRGERARAATASTTSSPPSADAEGAAGDIQWNFEKFLVSPEGEVVARFRPGVEPEDPGLVERRRRGTPGQRSGSHSGQHASSASTRRVARSSTSPITSRRSARGAATGCARCSSPTPPPAWRSWRRGRDPSPTSSTTLDRLLPRDDRYRHRHGAPGPRRRSPASRPRVAVAGAAGARRARRSGHVAARGAGRHQRRQSRPPGPAQLRRRLLGAAGLIGHRP